MLFNDVWQNYIIYILAFLIIWLLVLSIFLYKSLRHYKNLLGKTKKQDLKQILETMLKKIENQEKDTENLVKRCSLIEKKGVNHFQKLGFLRFNPFSDTGGDQSFVVSLLDGEGNGLVLNSLHSRGTTRLYAKSIKKGEADLKIELSKEEKEAIKKALSRRS
ncbi:DUF4446 family protein [Patescibacteria group bacterium]